MYPTRMGGCALLSISCMFSTKSETVFRPFNPRSGDRMRRAVGLGLLVLAATPLTLAAQGVAAADSLARAANTAAAANTVAINFVWTLVAGFLVMFMQAGFAMVETGFTRAKNAAHTMTMNFMVYGIAMLAYWAVGFAIQAGGVMAFFAAALLGPRRGKYNYDGSANAIPGHNIPMALAGTFILAFGWFGFNAGSTLAGSDLRIGVIATNTMLAGAAGGITAMVYMWIRYGKPDLSMLAHGTLAGLVAITGPCAFVTAPAALLIGGVAGVLVCAAVFFIERRLRIDDPVGAISVHGVNGLWGILSLGLLADGTYGDGWNGVNGAVRGLFYGDAGQFAAQLVGGVTNFVAVGAMTYVAYTITAVLVGGHRVAPEIEELGLDLPQMAAQAYRDTPERAAAVTLSQPTDVSLGSGLEPEPEAA